MEVNDYQRIIERELLRNPAPSDTCAQLARALFDAAGEPNERLLGAVLEVEKEAETRGCRQAQLHALFILAAEYATRLDEAGVDRTNAALSKLKTQMDAEGNTRGS